MKYRIILDKDGYFITQYKNFLWWNLTVKGYMYPEQRTVIIRHTTYNSAYNFILEYHEKNRNKSKVVKELELL